MFIIEEHCFFQNQTFSWISIPIKLTMKVAQMERYGFFFNEIISLENISKGGIEYLSLGIFTHNLKIELVKK